MRACRRVRDEAVHFFGYIFAQIVERSDRGAVSGDFSPVHPRAGRIALEIVAGVGGQIARCQIDAVIADLGLAGDDDGVLVGRGFVGKGRSGEGKADRQCRGCGQSLEFAIHGFESPLIEYAFI